MCNFDNMTAKLKKEGMLVKCLFVMPQVCRKFGDPYRFPIGMCYISGMIKAKGFNVINLNLNHKKESVELVLEEYIKIHQIDVLLVGGLITHYSKIKKVVDVTKAINPKIITIVGGGVITGRPEIVMSGMENADFGIVNEGEYSVCELLEAIENKSSFERIAGILYRKNGELVINERRADIQNLDEIPYPDYDGFEMDYYLENRLGAYSNAVPNRTFGIVTSRSCPFQCTFCFHSCGNTYRQRSLENVFREIEYLIEKYQVEYFNIYDELFAVDEKRVKLFCETMKSYGIPWECSMRVDRVTEDMLQNFKDAGCALVGFGIESMSNVVLKSMKKHITTDMVNRAIRLAEKVGIPCGGNLIFGDIEETLDTARASLEWYKSNSSALMNLALIAVYPGSYLYNYALENNIIRDELNYIENGCLMINVSKMSDKEYAILVDEIENCRRKEFTTENSVKVIKIDKRNKNVDLEIRCAHCGEIFYYRNVDLLLPIMQRVCPQCQHEYGLDIVDCFSDLAEKAFGAYQDKKICIWGKVSFLDKMIGNTNLKNNENLYIVDKSPLKREFYVVNKEVLSPEILIDQDFKCVVVACVDYLEEIHAEVRMKYPDIEKVVGIYDFLFDELPE